VDRSFTEFRQAVLDAEIEHSKHRGKQYYPAVPDSELEVVEGRFKMRKSAAKDCRELLAAARAALEGDKKKNDDDATKTSSIGICSAYRDYNDDLRAWKNSFKKHYNEMIRSKKFVGQEHSKEAQKHMVRVLIPLKAPPGFSNHSHGTAVDFQTSFGGVNYVADSSQHDGWRTTWLYKWLTDGNGKTYGFKQLVTEEWHWDHA